MKVTEIQVLEHAIKDAMKGGLSKLDLLALLPPGHTDQHIMVMLYDHRFNKALWDDEQNYYLVCSNEKCDCTYNYWEDNENGMMQIRFCNQCGFKVNKEVDSVYNPWGFHVQKMALSGDPLAYIAKTKYGIKVEE